MERPEKLMEGTLYCPECGRSTPHSVVRTEDGQLRYEACLVGHGPGRPQAVAEIWKMEENPPFCLGKRFSGEWVAWARMRAYFAYKALMNLHEFYERTKTPDLQRQYEVEIKGGLAEE